VCHFQPTTGQLLVWLEMGVMMVMAVMVMAVYHHYYLRLRRKGYREAEEKHEAEQSFLHSLV
jgi:hypothetical protein